MLDIFYHINNNTQNSIQYMLNILSFYALKTDRFYNNLIAMRKNEYFGAMVCFEQTS